MITLSKDHNEADRLNDLASYSILDTIPEADFDYLTYAASKICGTPISLVSLVDNKRQWFKSNHGLATKETPREYAFCAHVINEPNKILVVEDSRKDDRFKDNPLVTGDPNIIFYAGVPLISNEGFPLGTLCVIDNKPNSLTKDQVYSLVSLSNQVMNLMVLRKNKKELELSLKKLEAKNKELEQFVYIAAHDLREPLNTITSFTEILEQNKNNNINEIEKKSLKYINNASNRMKRLIKGLLDYSKLGNKDCSKKINCNILVQAVIDDLNSLIIKSDADIYVGELPVINAYETELSFLFQNLITNALKFSKSDIKPYIAISSKKNKLGWEFSIKDNGIGIDLKYQHKIFSLFQKLHHEDEYEGTGIGLAHCKKIVDLHNGDLWLESELGKGSVFYFTIKEI